VSRATQVDIDLTLCQGHGRCYLLVPEVFEPGDDYGHARVHSAVDPGNAALRTKVGNAIKSCPEDALSWKKAVDRPEGA
jgi:ferredoxin